MSADLTGDGKTVLKLHYGTVLGLPGNQLHVSLQPESFRLVADLRSGPTMRTRTADGILARKDD